MINDLRHRLKNTRKLQPPLEDVGWSYGISGDYVTVIVDHWLNKYDFKKREAHLNKYPQFITNIQGKTIFDLCFIHLLGTASLRDVAPVSFAQAILSELSFH